MDDKDAQLRGKLEDLFSDLSESIQAEAGPAAPLKSTPERAPGADRLPTGQPLAALRALAEHTTDAILLSDLAGRVTFSNRACCDLLGYDYTPNEMVGLETSALWPDEERARLTSGTPSGVPLALTGEWRGEAMQRRKDGPLLRASLTIFPILDEQAQPIAVASIIRDFAEHKQAEEALAQERSLLRTLIDAMPDLIYVKDRQSRFVVVNQAQVRLLGGATPEDLLGKSDLDFFPRELAQKYYADEQAILQSGQPQIGLEEPTVDTAGNKKWLTTTKVPLRDSHGQVTGFVGVGRDITERKQVEEAVAEERNLLHALIDNIPDRIYAKDTESRFIICNLASARRMGMTSPDELVGKSDFDFVPRELAERFYADEQAIIRSGQPLLNREEPLETVDGKITRWNLATKVPLRDSQGNIIGIVGLGREITDLKQTQVKLERNALQLRTAAEVSRAASSIINLDELLPQMVELIRDRFNLYYVGIFLVNEADQYAVLRAGTGEAGRTMLEAGHKLEVGGASMIGWCIANQKARIALDVGTEAVRFGNPLLPLTRSELALPLVCRGEVIGALTVQSAQAAAFSDEDITVLQTMADQVANAIANAQLYDQSQKEITERKRTEEALTREQYLMYALMNSLPDHIYFKDAQSRFIRISKSQSDLFGLSDPAQAVGKSDFDFFSEEHARPAYEDEQEIIRTGRPLVGMEEKETWADRPDTWVSTTKMPLRDEAGNIVGTFGISSDITERKRAEAERERLMDTLARRAVQLQTSAEVSHAAASILNLDELLPRTVELIRDHFGLYYTGIFLTDETGQWAVLRAGTGQAGHKMLEANHRLQIGGASMIGWCVANAQARIALDVGEEAVRFGNPLLPLTRSEMALPLVSRSRVIGAMTIQSDQPAAFTQEDITSFQSMADQMASAIENAQLFEQTLAARQQAEVRLREMQMLQQVIQAASGTLDLERVLDALFDVLAQQMGFTFIALNLIDESANEVRTVRAAGLARRMNGVVRPLSQMQNDIVVDVARKGQIEVIDGWDDRFSREIFEREGHAALVRAFVPLLLREKAIGTLEAGYSRQERAIITPEEVRLLGSLASQVAVAVENVRLFEASQRRATQERLTAAVSARMRETLDIDTVLQTAIREIGDAMGITEVEVRLASDVKNN
jgi:PAS domain S-box-containing protein